MANKAKGSFYRGKMVRTFVNKQESTEEIRVLRRRIADLEALAAGQKADKKSSRAEDEQKYRAIF